MTVWFISRITLCLLFLFSCCELALSQTAPQHVEAACIHKSHRKSHKRRDNLPPAESRASILRSDTIDITHMDLTLDLTEKANQLISGSCRVDFEAKMDNVDRLLLDLLTLTVDSVTTANGTLSFSHDDTLLIIDLGTPLNTGQSSNLTVHYHGSPVMDNSGWGGFYFAGDYAYNLGVGFDADPHNFGRAWYPCFDNFVERSTYDFHVTTANGDRASCNGTLVNSTSLGGDTVVWNYAIQDPIPSYLTCIAVAEYTTVNWTYNGILGNIPVELHALPADTTDLKSSFINLDQTIQAFENRFGPYRFEKVGYSIVPFNAGAMEHASNITYPRYAVNGSLANETLMAHELAHMWFGDLATCRTAEDMWLNEGMASFCEMIFLEELYGWDAYIERVNEDHLQMLRWAHINEEEYRAVSGVPHEYTYGDHVYTKGSLIAHTLRGYMGDTDFFDGLTSFLNNNQMTDVSSHDLRDELEAATGQDLDGFFNGWVFGPGWPQFEIDSVVVSPTPGLTDVTVYVQQKLTGAPNFHEDVPLEFRFRDANWNEYVETAVVSGEFSTVQFSLPITPAYTDLNPNNRISHAVSDHQLVITQTGTVPVSRALIDNFNVQQMSDSSFIRLEHHWAAPDPIQAPGFHPWLLSNRRYWSIQGQLANDFQATCRIVYDGRTQSSSNGWLDQDLFDFYSEDSLQLLYRSSPAEDWAPYPHYTKNMLNDPLDKFGVMDLTEVLPGEYCLGMFDMALSTEDQTAVESSVPVFPNPAHGPATFDLSSLKQKPAALTILDQQGKIVRQETVFGGQRIDLDFQELATGNYHYRIQQDDQVFVGKLVLMR